MITENTGWSIEYNLIGGHPVNNSFILTLQTKMR